MIAFLAVIYTAVVLVLFKVMHIKPTAYLIASLILAGVVMVGGVVVGWSQGGTAYGQDGDEPVCGSARPLREGASQSRARPGTPTCEERRPAPGV
jgi:hypothetical protein